MQDSEFEDDEIKLLRRPEDDHQKQDRFVNIRHLSPTNFGTGDGLISAGGSRLASQRRSFGIECIYGFYEILRVYRFKGLKIALTQRDLSQE